MQAHLTPHPSITIYFKATSKELLFWEKRPNAYLGKLSSFQVEPTFLNPSSTLVSPIPVVCIQSQVSNSSPMKSILRCLRTPTHTQMEEGGRSILTAVCLRERQVNACRCCIPSLYCSHCIQTPLAEFWSWSRDREKREIVDRPTLEALHFINRAGEAAPS